MPHFDIVDDNQDTICDIIPIRLNLIKDKIKLCKIGYYSGDRFYCTRDMKSHSLLFIDKNCDIPTMYNCIEKGEVDIDTNYYIYKL